MSGDDEEEGEASIVCRLFSVYTNLFRVRFQFRCPVGEKCDHGQECNNEDPSDDFVRYECKIVVAEEYDNNGRFLDVIVDAG